MTDPAAWVENLSKDRPVLITDIHDAVGKAGTGGTLPFVLDAIKDQANPLTIVMPFFANCVANVCATSRP